MFQRGRPRTGRDTKNRVESSILSSILSSFRRGSFQSEYGGSVSKSLHKKVMSFIDEGLMSIESSQSSQIPYLTNYKKMSQRGQVNYKHP